MGAWFYTPGRWGVGWWHARAPEQLPRMTKRVFISYSHDSGPHCQRVLDVADQLRAHGLDVHLDQ
jgi:hypothetical protein